MTTAELLLRDALSTARPRVGLAAFVIVTLQLWASVAFAQLIKSVEAIGMTVSDIDRATDFFSNVLHFEKISGRVVSPEFAILPDTDFGPLRVFLARDPDGHGLQIVEN